MRSLLFLLGCVNLAIMLNGCKDCGPSAEPLLTCNLSQKTRQKLDTLYALNTINTLPQQPYSTTAITTNKQLVLPVNLNADSSQYVFQLNGQRDTLTVFYKRKYSYRDTKCGYVLDLIEPAGQKAKVTRGEVGSVIYEQNSYQRTFLQSARETGIFLTIQL